MLKSNKTQYLKNFSINELNLFFEYIGHKYIGTLSCTSSIRIRKRFSSKHVWSLGLQPPIRRWFVLSSAMHMTHLLSWAK